MTRTVSSAIVQYALTNHLGDRYGYRYSGQQFPLREGWGPIRYVSMQRGDRLSAVWCRRKTLNARWQFTLLPVHIFPETDLTPHRRTVWDPYQYHVFVFPDGSVSFNFQVWMPRRGSQGAVNLFLRRRGR